MSGWVALAGLVAAAAVLLGRLGFPRLLASFALAALMLGAAGYALQGAPALAEAPARPPSTDRAVDVEAEVIELRNAMFGRFSGDAAYVTAADAMTRFGSPRAAVGAVLGGIRKYPDSLMLWNELGGVLARNDGGLSPAARFAFGRAHALNRAHPAPYFFQGLALVRDGDFAAARPLWARALTLSPPGAGYRGAIAIRLALLDQYLAASDDAARR